MTRAVAAAGLMLVAAATTMQLRSADFSAGGVIPQALMATDCGGRNRSPELTWTAVPSGAKSLALILRDPDAPIPGGFYHWVVYNLPVTLAGLPAGAKLGAGRLGRTTAGAPGYYGPCPPPGPSHHYVFTLYALDVAHLAAGTALSAEELEQRMAGHVVARAVLQAGASHP